MGDKTTRDAIPEFETLEEIADFWDKHSTADYDDVTREAHFEIRLRESRPEYQMTVQLLPELGATIQRQANKRGVSIETLVNVWLTEKVLELEAAKQV